MNLSRAILLINPNIRVIETQYEVDPPPGSPSRDAPKKTLFKTLDPTIKVGDIVLVPTSTRWKASANKVTAVDVQIDDHDAPGELKWLIDRVDMTAYDRSVAMEQEAFTVMRDAEKKRKQTELLKSIYEANPGLKDAAIANASFAKITGPTIDAHGYETPPYAPSPPHPAGAPEPTEEPFDSSIF